MRRRRRAGCNSQPRVCCAGSPPASSRLLARPGLPRLESELAQQPHEQLQWPRLGVMSQNACARIGDQPSIWRARSLQLSVPLTPGACHSLTPLPHGAAESGDLPALRGRGVAAGAGAGPVSHRGHVGHLGGQLLCVPAAGGRAAGRPELPRSTVCADLGFHLPVHAVPAGRLRLRSLAALAGDQVGRLATGFGPWRSRMGLNPLRTRRRQYRRLATDNGAAVEGAAPPGSERRVSDPAADSQVVHGADLATQDEECRRAALWVRCVRTLSDSVPCLRCPCVCCRAAVDDGR